MFLRLSKAIKGQLAGATALKQKDLRQKMPYTKLKFKGQIELVIFVASICSNNE